jgi:hypothetical protein
LSLGPFWIANLVIISISVIVFAVITVSYIKSYLRLKAGSFTSIIAFSSILMIQSILAFVIYYSLSMHFGSSLAVLLLVINVISLGGYVMLYKALQI